MSFWVTKKNSFSPANSQIYNGRKGTREASKSLPPCSLHSALDVEANACTSIIFLKTRGLGNTNPPMLGTSGCNYARGFHIFTLILRLVGKFLQESKIMCGTICNSFRTQCAYFFHRKTSVANQTHFRIYKHVFGGHK